MHLCFRGWSIFICNRSYFKMSYLPVSITS